MKYNIPANLQEALTLPGSSENLVYQLFLKQILFHGSYGAIRTKVTELIEDRNIAKRDWICGKKVVTKTEVEADGKLTKVWYDGDGKALSESQALTVKIETDAEFFLRVCASQGVEPTSFTELVQEAANLIPFDVTRKERVASEKKASKPLIKMATEIADNGALERVASQLSFDLGIEIDVTGDRDDAINNLAHAIGEDVRREAERRKSKYSTMGV